MREMNTSQERLLHGSVAKALILFAAPIILSNLVQNLYGTVDLIVVGQFAGTLSLSGVNIGSNIVNLVTNLCIGLCQGGVALIGQYLGSGSEERLSKAVRSLFTGLLVLALLIMILLLVLLHPILQLVQTPAESFAETRNYLFISAIGMVFIFGYNALAAVLRGIGDSRDPFLFVIVACCVNILGDLALVAGLGLGSAGAALATVFAQMVSMVLCIAFLKRRKMLFDFKLRSFRIDWKELRLLLQFGLPTCIQNGVTSLSFVVLTGITNSLGVVASAASAAGGKLISFGILPGIANTAAVSSMVAINEGAGQRKRTLEITRSSLVLIYALNLVIFAAVELFARPLVGIFSTDPQVVEVGITYVRVFALDLVITPVLSSFSGLFIGTGHTVVTSVLNACSAFLVRIPVAALFGLVFGWGMRGVGMGAPASSLLVDIVCVVYFLGGKWKKVVLKDLN